MVPLYPKIEPYKQHMLRVSDNHTLYVEESGSKDGIPVLFIHGGPGRGTIPCDRRFFHPKAYRIILFDQRGCGLSTPSSSIENNTTADTIEDIEKIRQHLDIDKFLLFGGSFGSTLALLYALKYPKNVYSLILRGIFLARKTDIDWFYSPFGAAKIYPDKWSEVVSALGDKSPIENIAEEYSKKLTKLDEIAKMHLAKAFSRWACTCATLEHSPEIEKTFSKPKTALAVTMLQTHYAKNKFFISENEIIKNVHKLDKIHGTIIHGRFDMVCPLDNAYALYKKWKNCELNIIRKAGHLASEPAITNALINATDQFAEDKGYLKL